MGLFPFVIFQWCWQTAWLPYGLPMIYKWCWRPTLSLVGNGSQQHRSCVELALLPPPLPLTPLLLLQLRRGKQADPLLCDPWVSEHSPDSSHFPSWRTETYGGEISHCTSGKAERGSRRLLNDLGHAAGTDGCRGGGGRVPRGEVGWGTVGEEGRVAARLRWDSSRIETSHRRLSYFFGESDFGQASLLSVRAEVKAMAKGPTSVG